MNHLKTIALWVLAICGAVFLTLVILGGIQGVRETFTADDIATPRPTTAATLSQPPPPSSSARGLYLDDLASWTADKPYNLVDSATDDELFTMALLVCGILDDGQGVQSLMDTVVDGLGNAEDIDYEAAGTLIGAAVWRICPEHQPAIDEWLGL